MAGLECGKQPRIYAMATDKVPARTLSAGSKERTRTPVADRIRERIQKAGGRFFANDNIAEYLEPGDLDALIDEVEGEFKHVLSALVIDTANDHNTQDT